MTHEFKSIIDQALKWQQIGKKSVLATVVDLEGSSYRRPGVRMLLNEKGEAVGAVSGGCVEKEIYVQANSVFKDGKPKMMTYDGRLRLGCEGIIYVLIEPFEISNELLQAFDSAIKNRNPMEIRSQYKKEYGVFAHIGSSILIHNNTYFFSADVKDNDELLQFKQLLPPLFQLIIIGAEHDAVQLSKIASNLGWDVTVLASADEAKTIDYFKGASQLLTPMYNQIDTSNIDEETAIVLMTHSFNKDVQYLLALKDVKPAYFGLLGPKHRRERVIEKLIEFNPHIDFDFVNQLRGPAGINIGAESAQEIAISIISEILSVVRNQDPMVLKDKKGTIHA